MKILIDEAAVRQYVYATAMVIDCAQLEDWQLELYDKAGADLAEALSDAALDKKADNARELGLSYMESSAEQYEKELRSLEKATRDCDDIAEQRALDALLRIQKENTEQPAPVRYQRIERGEGDWMDCTKEQYEKAMALPEWDTRVIATQPAPAQPNHVEDALTMVEPPTKDEIRQAFKAHDARFPLVSSMWSFEAGIEFAEKHYGITKGGA